MHSLIPAVLGFVLLLSQAQTSAAVSTITMTATSPPTPASTSYTSDSDFESAMLDAHNFYRNEHNTSNLVWNDTSAKYATSYSAQCEFKHSGGPTGENLAAGYSNATGSVDAWGLERENYNWKKPGFSEATGHFTQMVWSNTTSVGCGRKECNGTNATPGWYVVCEYYPAGNVEGDDNQFFIDNVKKQTKGKLSDTVESGVSSSGGGWRELRSWFGVLVIAGFVSMGIVW